MYNKTNILNDNMAMDVRHTNNSSSGSEISFDDIFSGDIVHIDTESLKKIDENLQKLREEVEQDGIKIQRLGDELKAIVNAGNFLLNVNSIKQEKK